MNYPAELKDQERSNEEARLLTELMRIKKARKKCEFRLMLDGSGYVAKGKVEYYV